MISPKLNREGAKSPVRFPFNCYTPLNFFSRACELFAASAEEAAENPRAMEPLRAPAGQRVQGEERGRFSPSMLRSRVPAPTCPPGLGTASGAHRPRLPPVTVTSGGALGGRRAAPGGGERSGPGPGAGSGLACLGGAAGAAHRGPPALGKGWGVGDRGSPQLFGSTEWAHPALCGKVKWMR